MEESVYLTGEEAQEESFDFLLIISMLTIQSTNLERNKSNHLKIALEKRVR